MEKQVIVWLVIMVFIMLGLVIKAHHKAETLVLDLQREKDIIKELKQKNIALDQHVKALINARIDKYPPIFDFLKNLINAQTRPNYVCEGTGSVPLLYIVKDNDIGKTFITSTSSSPELKKSYDLEALQRFSIDQIFELEPKELERFNEHILAEIKRLFVEAISEKLMEEGFLEFRRIDHYSPKPKIAVRLRYYSSKEIEL